MAHPYQTPDLPYAYDALAPYLDEETMHVHHDKHHVAYTTKLNAAVEQHPELVDREAADLLRNLDALPEDIRTAVRNNGGGHVNHAFFWESMATPAGQQPAGELRDALDQAFGSFEQFQEKFSEAATTLFGSGWAWLTIQGGKLAIEQTPNQDTPLSSGRAPLLALDVWEHAYYLKYRNVRPDYIKAWWNVVNWDTVGERFNAEND